MAPRTAIAGFIESLRGRVRGRRRRNAKKKSNVSVPDHSAAPLRGILRHAVGCHPHRQPPSSLLRSPGNGHNEEAAARRSPLELVPIDILLCILDFCSPTDRLCLGLTCHSLYSRLFDRSLARRSAVNLALLTRLEHDLPQLYFCHPCDRLHHWQRREPTTAALARRPRRRNRTRSGESQELDYAGQGCTVKMLYSPRFNPVYSLPFYLAHLAVKYRQLSPELGHPLRRLRFGAALSLEGDMGNRSGRRMLDITGTARVIDDELYMAVSYVFYCDYPRTEDLRAFLDETPLFVCCSLRTDAHVDAQGLDAPVRGRRIPELAPPKGEGRYFEACVDASGSCESCLTDYEVSVACFPDQEGWVVGLMTYQLFGRCRSPSDEKWRLMTGDSVPGSRRIKYNRAGSVRDRFRETEHVEDMPLR
ncbi:hypothetical protein PLICBS_003090 [Purpureocillium lilacinum]|uniref:uncharacterized protein n=1 Tax=Purpureocillium lilacinum TaxID=33203 RepID=UPI002081CD19|nr:hypothetical protein PLICBS_003090 [Purpureocillium lilacinum]